MRVSRAFDAFGDEYETHARTWFDDGGAARERSWDRAGV